jgi:hypothetical protein
VIIEEHAMRIAALAALETDPDNLSAFGVIAEAGAIGHTDELELRQGLVDLQGLRHQLPQLLRVAPLVARQPRVVAELPLFTIAEEQGQSRRWIASQPVDRPFDSLR